MKCLSSPLMIFSLLLTTPALPLRHAALQTPPDTGGWIAFTSDREAPFQYEIYSMNTDGSDQRNLTQTAGADTDPVWSPDGQQIAFNSDRDGNTRIYVMNADGSDQRALTPPGGSDYDPAWAPDGSQVAFSSNRDGNIDVYVINRDGSDQRRLTYSAKPLAE
jgi:Tol biopolymer transport system component